jgi:hypothetical protein
MPHTQTSPQRVFFADGATGVAGQDGAERERHTAVEPDVLTAPADC